MLCYHANDIHGYKTNKVAETAMLEALRPPLDTNIAGTCGDLYAVWASKAVVDKFRESWRQGRGKIRQK